MRRKHITLFCVLSFCCLLILYTTNEKFRSQFGSILKKDVSQRPFKRNPFKTESVEASLWQPTKQKINKENGDNKNVDKDDDIDDDELVEKMKMMMKTKHELLKIDKSVNDHSEITVEEINQFHEKNAKDLEDQQNTSNEFNKQSTIKTSVVQTTTEVFKDGIERKGVLKKRFPQAIIAGVKKSGTRALLSFLSRHPLVKSAGKEIHFFDKDENYEEGLDWYLDQMPESYANELTIEKTPGYFIKPYVPKRVSDFSKSVKLIFIFREPVERAVSDYAQALANERKIKFEKTVFTKSKPRKVNVDSSKVSIGMYSKHLINWLHYFPRKQMHFVNGNEFIKNPVPGIIKVQKFLGLPVLLNEKHFVFNKTKGFYCTLNNKESSEIKCLGDSKGRTHPQVRESALWKLKEFYKPWNEKFFELIGENFGWPTTKNDTDKNDT